MFMEVILTKALARIYIFKTKWNLFNYAPLNYAYKLPTTIKAFLILKTYSMTM